MDREQILRFKLTVVELLLVGEREFTRDRHGAAQQNLQHYVHTDCKLEGLTDTVKVFGDSMSVRFSYRKSLRITSILTK